MEMYLRIAIESASSDLQSAVMPAPDNTGPQAKILAITLRCRRVIKARQTKMRVKISTVFV